MFKVKRYLEIDPQEFLSSHFSYDKNNEAIDTKMIIIVKEVIELKQNAEQWPNFLESSNILINPGAKSLLMYLIKIQAQC